MDLPETREEVSSGGRHPGASPRRLWGMRMALPHRISLSPPFSPHTNLPSPIPNPISNTYLNPNSDQLKYCSFAPKPSAIALHSLCSVTSASFRPSASGATNSASSSRGGDSGVARVRASKSAYSSRRVLPIRALLALSAAAAVVFLRKRRSLQTSKVRGSVAFNQGEGMEKMTRIDTHLHVWASPEEAKKFPYFPGQEPTLPGSADFLLKSMAEAGVDGAVIVQPINHKFDHSYVSSVLKMYPEKFVGMCLADPTEGGGGVKELERLIVKENFSGVRFNPYLWPSGQKMTNEVGKAMFIKAGELRVPVGFMCFKGLMLHVDEIEELCREFPRTKVLMDHLGFCKPPLTDEEAEAWNRLLNLSKYSQVYVKLSAFFRVSREPFPYKDTWPSLKQLLEAYGADRLMWGSDFPFVTAECGYTNAWQVLPSENSADAFFTKEQLNWVMSGTANSVFQSGWRKFGTLPDSSDLGDEILT